MCSFDMVVGIIAFMHNSLIVANSSTPYQDVVSGLNARGDAKGPDETQRQLPAMDIAGQRSLARIREIAAAKIIEAAARPRLERAVHHRTIPAGENLEFDVDDVVDIWYDPPHKEISGWRGPAKVLSLNDGEGNITVQCQGRPLIRRNQEVRVHVPFLVFLMDLFSHQDASWHHLKQHCENLQWPDHVVL